MLVLNKQAVEALIKQTLGIDYCAEDKEYNALPERWFDGSWFEEYVGRERLYYVEDGFDCDNWADKLRMEYKDRYLKQYVKKHSSPYGTTQYPDIFVECIKVSYLGVQTPHWFVCAVADVKGKATLIYRERTETDVDVPRSGWQVERLK